MRSIIIALVFIAWLILGYFLYNNHQTCCHGDDGVSKTEEPVKEPVAPVAAAKKAGPLVFNYDGAEAMTNEGWDAQRKSLLDKLGDNEKLQITGLYRADEKNDSSYENLGIARAKETAKLLMPPLTEDRIETVGKLVSDGMTTADDPFASVSFRNVRNSASVKETANETTIRFPFNSTNKLNDNEVENYLDEVAERVKASGERVSLVGHTDNIGSDASNVTLGQRRANIIKNYLVRKGVPAKQITASSEGEASPVSPNSTKKGRAENRRTVLKIIK